MYALFNFDRCTDLRYGRGLGEKQHRGRTKEEAPRGSKRKRWRNSVPFCVPTRLEQFSATFSRAVDEAVAEQLEPFNTSTDDPNYLEFVDQTEELKREYEGTIDCIKLPQGKIVPARYGFYQNRSEIQNGKVFQRKAGPARQPPPHQAGQTDAGVSKTIRFKSCTEISGSLRRNGPLPTGTKNSKLTDITAIRCPVGLVFHWGTLALPAPCEGTPAPSMYPVSLNPAMRTAIGGRQRDTDGQRRQDEEHPVGCHSEAPPRGLGGNVIPD